MHLIEWFFLFGAALWFGAGSCLGEALRVSATVRMEFKEPRQTAYQIEMPSTPAAVEKSQPSPVLWLTAWPEIGAGDSVKFGSRVVLELEDGADLETLIQGRALQLSRTITPSVFILQAPDAPTAAREAASLGEDPRVSACYPVSQRPRKLFGRYAARPNDPLFAQSRDDAIWQPYLENRDANGTSLGVDLNVRAAWTVSRGQGIIIAFGDDGIELTHPDLAAQVQGMPHFNFMTREPDGSPAGPLANHATAVAGLAAAAGNNKIGISGVAPAARLASWVLFSSSDRLEVTDEGLMDMYQYQSNVVSIQNQSWGKDGREQVRLTTLESIGISNAVTFGRSGRGTIIVRAGGNGRMRIFNADDDGYINDPRVIPVAAVRFDGRVARYSTPGACLLVAAPSGDVDEEFNPCTPDSPNLLTTDRQGANGFNVNIFTNDLADYAWGREGFSGTSAATPQIAGLAALILAVNTNLTYRDVQQIMIHSARHFDFADPDLRTNRAGFLFSHNLGFGVPDAGLAVALARNWPTRPPLSKVTYAATNSAAIPDQGLRVLVQGQAVPTNLLSLVALPGLEPFPEAPTASVPLVDVGTTTNGISVDLSGRAALIQRGGNFFCEKLALAAAARAALAIVYNNRDGDARIVMGASEFAPIPSVFLSQTDGEALQQYLLGDPTVRVQFVLQTTNYSFAVKESLLCEHVGVRIDTDHNRRGDLRIVLTSPGGTRSILQNVNNDDAPGPIDWTYYSTQHFYEASAGTWTVSISDLDSKGTGVVKSLSLIITGAPIEDTDRDGLDDVWERRHFGSLEFGPQDDPDRDGYINAREQIMGTNPTVADDPFQLDLSLWNERLVRLSWPSSAKTTYEIRTGSEAVKLLNLATNIPGRFHETEWFTPYTNLVHEFFRVQGTVPDPAAR